MECTKIWNSVQLGVQLRKRRKALGYTLKDISVFAGCNIRFLSELERGKPTAQTGKMIEVVQTLGMDLALVTRGDEQ